MFPLSTRVDSIKTPQSFGHGNLANEVTGFRKQDSRAPSISSIGWESTWSFDQGQGLPFRIPAPLPLMTQEGTQGFEEHIKAGGQGWGQVIDEERLVELAIHAMAVSQKYSLVRHLGSLLSSFFPLLKS